MAGTRGRKGAPFAPLIGRGGRADPRLAMGVVLLRGFASWT